MVQAVDIGSRVRVVRARRRGQYSGRVTDRSRRNVNKQLSGFDQPLVTTFAVNYRIPALSADGIISSILGNWQSGCGDLRFRPADPRTAVAKPAEYTVVGSDVQCDAHSRRAAVYERPGLPLFRSRKNVRAEQGCVGRSTCGGVWYSGIVLQRLPISTAAAGERSAGTVIPADGRRESSDSRRIFEYIQSASCAKSDVGECSCDASCTINGYTLSGFGRIDTLSPAVGQRTGTILMRLRF